MEEERPLKLDGQEKGDDGEAAKSRELRKNFNRMSRSGSRHTITVRGDIREICDKSLWIFPAEGAFRRKVLALVNSVKFDYFILALILIGSVCEACYQYRQPCDQGFNYFVRNPLDWALTLFFTLELLLKVVAWGLILDEGSYLRDPWNWLDFIVVITAIVGIANGSSCEGGGLSFLRVFRVLRPLRSLKSIPKMKMLVNTALSALPKLNFVIIMALFLFFIFGIIGITLMEGVFYRRCREGVNSRPTIVTNVDGSDCWSWAYVDPDIEPRLCGGRYMCEESGGTCAGHEEDPEESLRPKFDGGKQGLPWCAGSEPRKLIPETDFIHFDHIGGALLAIFQSMTLEGWTEIMYWVQDSYSAVFGTFYFAAVVMITSWFTLNVALAVVDEARDEFYATEPLEEKAPGTEETDPWLNEASRRISADAGDGVSKVASDVIEPIGNPSCGSEPEAANASGEDADEVDEPLWWDHAVVKVFSCIAKSDIFQNLVMFFIIGNVVTMSMTMHPPQMYLREFLAVCEVTFLVVFTLEMAIMLIALGPIGYVKNPITRFDCLIVLISYVEMALSGGSALRALRTMRLFRVINKFASRSAAIRVLLKSMVETVMALNYWLVLFLIVLYIFTLMSMSFFATNFHFTDPDTFASTSSTRGQAWCNTDRHLTWHQRQDCIPRAHFDTFLWAFITVFQIMTGENWNTVMYAGMRAGDPHPDGGWLMAVLFIFLIFFGQILFLSLFLSMLLSTFEEAQVREKEKEKKRQEMVRARAKANISRASSRCFSMKIFASSVSRPWGTASSRGSSKMSERVSKCEDAVEDVSASEQTRKGRTNKEAFPGLGQGVVPCAPVVETAHVKVKPASAPKPAQTDSSPGISSLTLPGQADLGDDVGCESLESLDVPAAGPAAAAAASSVFPSPSPLQQRPGSATKPLRLDTLTPPAAAAGGDSSPSDRGAAAPASAAQSGSGSQGSTPRRCQQQQQDVAEAVGKGPPVADPDVSQSAVEPLDPGEAKPQGVDEQSDEIVELPEPPVEAHASSLQSLSSTAPSSRGSNLPWFCHNSLLIFSQENKFRQFCRWLLEAEVTWPGKGNKAPVTFKAFDNIILFCIAVSTCVMAADNPLRDPSAPFTQVLRMADKVFAIVFIVEMLIKLVAMGLIGRKAYLSSAWNWLDGVVVLVSVVTMVSAGGGGATLKTFRILRAFRPLRIISRNEGLKKVVNTIVNSLPELGMVAIMALIFIFICALVALSLLHGKFYHCDGEDSAFYLRDGAVVAPLCLGPEALDHTGALARGSFDRDTTTWSGSASSCSGATPVPWQRASKDTPICVGRCSPYDQASNTTLCPVPFESTAELPPVGNCASSRSWTAAELRGQEYVNAMTRFLVLPCGGYMLDEQTNQVTQPANVASCAATFCPGVGLASTNCAQECQKHPYYCAESCPTGKPVTQQCEACRRECEAQCSCPAFCQPLLKDAALCAEQGFQWVRSLSQNFNTIWNSIVTLFEISTTEGWVDVMYAAVDSEDWYVQPLRDSNQWLWGIFFVGYIFFFSMFVLNLFVGVIVTQFLELKKQYNAAGKADEFMVGMDQRKLFRYLHTFFHAPAPWSLTQLSRLPPFRRRIFNLVAADRFEHFIMGCICTNALVMAMKTFPEIATWWGTLLLYASYVFAAIFTCEMLLKMYALRLAYFKENWNIFDSFCVVATLAGFILKAFSDVNVGSITSMVRIVRIARMFRLLRLKSLQGLKKIFAALILSIPKLMNVFMILALFLILYSILGVNLFSTAKTNGETLNHHGNFINFEWAFVTLFRATTGEAWNEIMHDLARDEADFFEAGDWCSPANLFDTINNWDELNGKCLIQSPNSCVSPLIGPWGVWPVIYWVSYTLIVAMVIMNLVIAVILEGYEDGREESPEQRVIEVCVQKWPKFDPDRDLRAPLPQALRFINDSLSEISSTRKEACTRLPILWKKSEDGRELKFSGLQAPLRRSDSLTMDLRTIPMRFASLMQLDVQEDLSVTFAMATRQVLIFASIAEESGRKFDFSMVDKSSLKRLQELESRVGDSFALRMRNALGVSAAGSDLTSHVAAAKLQHVYRARKRNRLGAKTDSPENAASRDAVVECAVGATPRRAG